MKKQSRILIITNLLLLLGYLNWSIYQKEQTLRDGQLVLFELAPVDPRSLMQGDYMSLRYREATSDLLGDTQVATHGYAVLNIDSNRVARIVRLKDALEPLNDNELIINYKIVNDRLFLGAESFFFEEGQDTLYQKATYGGLKVNAKGESLLVVGILRGAIMFMVDLLKKLEIDDVQIDFMAVSSYGSSTVSSGKINIKKDLSESIEGRNVLIVEDIIDTGNTLYHLIEYLQKDNPKSVKLCTLFDKPERREKEVPVDWVGFDIPNKFIVGYGLDYAQRYRNLPYIAELAFVEDENEN